MATSKKYSYQLEKKDDFWRAQIIRKASSKTLIVSKEQEGFVSEEDAKKWAKEQLLVFTNTQSLSNKRQGEQRKLSAEESRQRSIRRSEKKALEKQAIADAELTVNNLNEEVVDDIEQEDL